MKRNSKASDKKLDSTSLLIMHHSNSDPQVPFVWTTISGLGKVRLVPFIRFLQSSKCSSVSYDVSIIIHNNKCALFSIFVTTSFLVMSLFRRWLLFYNSRLLYAYKALFTAVMRQSPTRQSINSRIFSPMQHMTDL